MAEATAAAATPAAVINTQNTKTPVENTPKPAPVAASSSAIGGGESLSDIAKEAIRKHKLKVDGQEVEVDDEELKRGYTHQRAANKILQEGKAARKQAEEFISMMKDPKKFFEIGSKLGHDARKLAEEYLAAQLEDELMDPRDKELKVTKQKLQQLEEIDKAQKKAQEDKVHAELKAKFAKEYSDQFVEALDKSGLPQTKPMVAEMAKYIQRSAQLGFKMTAIEAAKLVKEDVQTRVQRIIGDSDGETLIKILGDEVANKVRKWDTSRIKDPNQFIKTPQEQGERPQRTRGQPTKRMSPSEWRKFNRS